MEPKRSKYDTNPLDDKVANRAEQNSDSSRPGPPTEEVRGRRTRNVGRNDTESVRAYAESEAPTQRIDDNLASSYPSVFIKPPLRQTATYQPPRVPVSSIYQPPPAAPEDLFAAQRAMRARGERLLAIYHSHPRAKDPEPSATDVRLAYYPSAVYFIVGLGDKQPCLRAFRISEREGRWSLVDYTIVADANH